MPKKCFIFDGEIRKLTFAKVKFVLFIIRKDNKNNIIEFVAL